jgi:glycerol-1-phosphate dehydrogenase [NAD(P)+]
LSLDNIAQLTIDDLLNKEFECQCGKLHSVSIGRVIIGENAVSKLPDVLKSFNYNRIFMVADNNTYRVAGKNVENILLSLDFALSSVIYQRGSVLVPDERAIGQFMLNYNRNTDVIVAVGLGVINDISKYMGFILGVPYIIIATAPSTDGYTSDCSAFIINNTKISIPSSPPKVIIGDIEILKNAPMEMILSGLGDMVGKYSPLRDSKIGYIVTDEYYCEVIRKIVETSVTKCVQGVQGLKAGMKKITLYFHIELL